MIRPPKFTNPHHHNSDAPKGMFERYEATRAWQIMRKETDIIWPESTEEARKLQELHRDRVRIESLKREPVFIAGVDAAFSEDQVFAAACLYRYPEMTLVEQSSAIERSKFPYVPGYLLFLEGPAIINAVQALRIKPDLVLVDGQGLAHPRRIGSASHLGVLLDLPSIGCAKTRLIGEFSEPGRRKGNWSELRREGETVGAVLRTRDRVRPLFISPGHKIDLKDAIRITIGCAGKYRIPKPLRCADMLSRRMKALKSKTV